MHLGVVRNAIEMQREVLEQFLRLEEDVVDERRGPEEVALVGERGAQVGHGVRVADVEPHDALLEHVHRDADHLRRDEQQLHHAAVLDPVTENN